VQVRTHVREIVNPDFEPSRHATKRFAHDAVVLAHGPRPSSPVARENHMHRTSRAHGALELAAPAPQVAAVHCSRQFGMDLTTEKMQLHLD
jgi:hypothetical protein